MRALPQPRTPLQRSGLVPPAQVPTKVELHVGGLQAGEEPQQAALKKLGYLSFDSNERSSHQARELKSVHVSVGAQLLKLVVHRCHVNKHNIYNQVRRWRAGAAGVGWGGGGLAPSGAQASAGQRRQRAPSISEQRSAVQPGMG
jgi:hypothetical protein